MVNIPMNSAEPLTRQTIASVNQRCIQGVENSHSIMSIHNRMRNGQANVHNSMTTIAAAVDVPIVNKPIPPLKNMVQKGQKIPLETDGKLHHIKACLGWNVTNSACDVDVSAFLLNKNDKVMGDTWFVFYGQERSPDESTVFSAEQSADRENICINFTKMNPEVNKIVFVLTINEALEKHLNFSMLKDAYIRILEVPSGKEIVSFQMDEYYSNVTSMMIGEIYRYNGSWKFHAIGNGVAKDLAGLCELYGVQVI